MNQYTYRYKIYIYIYIILLYNYTDLSEVICSGVSLVSLQWHWCADRDMESQSISPLKVWSLNWIRCSNFAKGSCQEHLSLFCFAWTPRRDHDEKLLVETRKQHHGFTFWPNLDPEVLAQRLQGFHCCFLTLLAFSNIQYDFSRVGIESVMVTCSTRIMPLRDRRRTLHTKPVMVWLRRNLESCTDFYTFVHNDLWYI